jgi:ketosteroid isomerase-like protein
VTDFDNAFLRRDLHRFVGFYHRDASAVTSSGVINFTKADIRSRFKELFGYEFTAQFPLLKQAIVNCRTAVLVRNAAMQTPELEADSKFISTLVWVHTHGHWQVLADINTPIA